MNFLSLKIGFYTCIQLFTWNCHDIQWASRGAPGKSGLHASGEGERLIALEPW